MDNSALQDLTGGAEGGGKARAGGSAVPEQPPAKAFDAMNSVVAQLMLNLTASMRFDGALQKSLTYLAAFHHMCAIVSVPQARSTRISTRSR